jgi:hypothetical protein
VIYFSKLARCTVMDSGPNADFEIHFYDGWRIQHSARKAQLEVSEPHPTIPNQPIHIHSFNVNQGVPSDMSPKVVQHLLHAQQCLRKCLEIEQNTTSFPVIVRDEQLDASTSSSLNMRLNHLRTKSPTHTHQDDDDDDDDDDASRSDDQYSITAAPYTPARHPNMRNTGMHHIDTSPEASLLNDNTSHQLNTTTHYMADTGWMIRAIDGSTVELLFMDGKRLYINRTSRYLIWRDYQRGSRQERFALEDPLPAYVQEKLSLLPLFENTIHL